MGMWLASSAPGYRCVLRSSLKPKLRLRFSSPVVAPGVGLASQSMPSLCQPLLTIDRMTIWKQRFFRWNYFFVSGLYWDMYYIIRNWKLGWWEIGAKLFVFQEVYETLLYLLAPFVLPISFYVRPRFSGYMYLATIGLYQVNVIIFNYVSGAPFPFYHCGHPSDHVFLHSRTS